jgi:hypothetical protein
MLPSYTDSPENTLQVMEGEPCDRDLAVFFSVIVLPPFFSVVFCHYFTILFGLCKWGFIAF